MLAESVTQVSVHAVGVEARRGRVVVYSKTVLMFRTPARSGESASSSEARELERPISARSCRYLGFARPPAYSPVLRTVQYQKFT